MQAWDLDFGRISVLICFDVNFPELWLEAWALGAEIVFWPSTMSVDFDDLVPYALTHRYNIVGCGRPGAVIDIAGATVSPPDNCTALCESQATLDLDRTAVFGHDAANSTCASHAPTPLRLVFARAELTAGLLRAGEKVALMAKENPGDVVYERPA